MKAWRQKLSAEEEQLIAEVALLNSPTEGTIEDLRQRMRNYVDRNSISGNSRATTMTEELSLANGPAPRVTATGETLNQLRKFGLQSDGKDPLGFLEQVEELCNAVGFPQKLLLQGLPIFLKGALLWHRNNKKVFGEQFCREVMNHFLPTHFQAQLTQKILSR